MPRRKKASTPDLTKAIATSADPIKAGNKSRLAMKRAGLENIKQAFKLCDIEDRFANVYAAVGFASSIAAKAFTTKQINEFEATGRAKLAGLGVVEMGDDVGDETEVLVSVPIAQQDALTALYALGLKRTSMSTTRGYVELRGAAALETVKLLVADMRGVLTIVERPAIRPSEPQSANAKPVADRPALDDGRQDPAVIGTDQPQAERSTQPLPASTSATADLSDTSTRNVDEGARSSAIPLITDPSHGKHQGNSDVPPFMRRQGMMNPAAPATQVKSLPEVIASARDEPPKSARPPFRPPQSDSSPRRAEP